MPAGRAVDAAYDGDGDRSFYNVTLKNFVTPWTNRDQTVFAPLNDYTATVIGMVRDDVPFNTLLSADILYVGGRRAPAYSPANNDHYQALEISDVDLKTRAACTRRSRSLTGCRRTRRPASSRRAAASEAFFVAGTNRAMFRFTMLNHLCKDLEQVQDTTRPPDRIRQDVSRSPGGDSRIFLNNCIGCHSGMDPMAQAFAYYNFDETVGPPRLHAGPGAAEVPHQHRQLQAGLRHARRSLGQLLALGPQPLLGWDRRCPAAATARSRWGGSSPTATRSRAARWRRCSATCACARRAMGRTATRSTPWSTSFKANGYKLKRVFAEAAVYCKGD